VSSAESFASLRVQLGDTKAQLFEVRAQLDATCAESRHHQVAAKQSLQRETQRELRMAREALLGRGSFSGPMGVATAGAILKMPDRGNDGLRAPSCRENQPSQSLIATGLLPSA